VNNASARACPRKSSSPAHCRLRSSPLAEPGRRETMRRRRTHRARPGEPREASDARRERRLQQRTPLFGLTTPFVTLTPCLEQPPPPRPGRSASSPRWRSSVRR
jgi:hypothetical protein